MYSLAPSTDGAVNSAPFYRS